MTGEEKTLSDLAGIAVANNNDNTNTSFNWEQANNGIQLADHVCTVRDGCNETDSMESNKPSSSKPATLNYKLQPAPTDSVKTKWPSCCCLKVIINKEVPEVLKLDRDAQKKATKFNDFAKVVYLVVVISFNVAFWSVAMREYMRPAEEFLNENVLENDN